MAPHRTRCGRCDPSPHDAASALCASSDAPWRNAGRPLPGQRRITLRSIRAKRPQTPQSAPTLLVFCFRTTQDLLKALISLPKTGCFFLTLGEEFLQWPVQADGLIDLGAGTCPIGAEPDQLLHVGIGRHHPPG